MKKVKKKALSLSFVFLVSFFLFVREDIFGFFVIFESFSVKKASGE